MSDDRLVYRRDVSDPSSWRDFSIQHWAFALHRITGWLLLGWIVFHLAIPAADSPSAVWVPTSTIVIVLLLTILLFHLLNGTRLLVAELTGVGSATSRHAIVGTVVVCLILVVGLGGQL